MPLSTCGKQTNIKATKQLIANRVSFTVWKKVSPVHKNKNCKAHEEVVGRVFQVKRALM